MNPIFSKRSFWGGLLFIAAGVVLLMQNFNLLPFIIPSYVFTWKMFLVALGIFILPSKNWFTGLVLIGIGTYFLLPEFGIYNLTISQLWPIVLIVIGFMIINNKMKTPKKKIKINMEKSREDGYIENTVVFGNDSKKISSYDFKGGHVSVIFGGLEMDLTNCTLSKDKNVIDVEIVCGGLSLTVPREWNIKSEAVPIMGGVEDEITDHKDKYVDPAAELIIRGNVVMGGLEIKRV